jgi:hypothetical protein
VNMLAMMAKPQSRTTLLGGWLSDPAMNMLASMAKRQPPTSLLGGAGLLEASMARLSDAGAANQEAWVADSLREDVKTSAENESSVILLGLMGSGGALLTGDAGVKALSRAAAYSEVRGFHLPSYLQFVQVPHHGSRNNVSTSVLDRIVGPRKAYDDGLFDKYAFVSVGVSETHPRQRVVNAFVRRGARVLATQGTMKCYASGLAQVPAYWTQDAKPLQFSRKVEPWPAD